MWNEVHWHVNLEPWDAAPCPAFPARGTCLDSIMIGVKPNTARSIANNIAPRQSLRAPKSPTKPHWTRFSFPHRIYQSIMYSPRTVPRHQAPTPQVNRPSRPNSNKKYQPPHQRSGSHQSASYGGGGKSKMLAPPPEPKEIVIAYAHLFILPT